MVIYGPKKFQMGPKKSEGSQTWPSKFLALGQHCSTVALFIYFFRVLEITKKEKAKSRPQALNTVEMLRVASSGLGMCIIGLCFLNRGESGHIAVTGSLYMSRNMRFPTI